MTPRFRPMTQEKRTTKNEERRTSDESPIYEPRATIYEQPKTNNEERTTTHEQPTTPRPCEDDEINLLDYLRVIYKHKWMIMLFTIFAMGATVALSLSQPRMYQASTSIVPPIDRLSQGGGLASKLGGLGSGLLQGMLNQGDLSGLYVGLLESRAVSEALVDRFDLMNVYQNVKTRTDARGILKKQHNN